MWSWNSKTQRKLDKILAGQDILRRNQTTLNINQIFISRELDDIKSSIMVLLFKTTKPGLITITITDEKRGIEMDMIQFDINLPEKAAPDVISRELSVTIGDGDTEIKTLNGDDKLVADLEGPQGSTVVLSLVDVDDSGNRSQASTAEAVLLDTVPPPQPGALGVVVTGETHEEPPVEEPPVEEPPVEEPPVEEPPVV